MLRAIGKITFMEDIFLFEPPNKKNIKCIHVRNVDVRVLKWEK